MKITIIFFLFSLFCFSQKEYKISELDTIYVIFKGKKHEKLEQRLSSNTDTIKRFSFYNEFSSGKTNVEKIKFLYPSVLYFNEEKKVIFEKHLIDKSFISSHRKKIIDYRFFLKTGDLLETKFNNDTTIIYIIDISNKKDKINMYRVTPMIMAYKYYPE